MSKNLETRVSLTAITRTGTTTMGNPRWAFQTNCGKWQMQTNAGLGYALDNPEYREMIGHDVILTHTKADRVTNIRLA